ncbi:MAG: sigma-54-dependent Fis family transcriptional regulator [Betaproteobacteria bacterium]
MERNQAMRPEHARALAARAGTKPGEALPGGLILDSWARCLEAGLDPWKTPQIEVVSGTELALRQERAEVVRRLARAELETLSQQIAGSNFLLAFADHEGMILDLYADNRFSMSGSGAGIVPGSLWDECRAGTNGLGTALTVGQSVAVTGTEHYFHDLGGISCTAAPIRDAQGDLVGVLDASSYFESRQRHTLALVQMAATHIENGLLLHQMAGHTVLAIHPRAEFLGTLSAGMLAFDAEGRLSALNARARSLLSGLAVGRGAAFEQLFEQPFERLLARLSQDTEVRLRDAMGSTLVTRPVHRPSSALRLPMGGGFAVMGKAPHPGPRLGNALGNASAAAGAWQTARAVFPPRATGKATAAAQRPAFLADDPVVEKACSTVRRAVRMGVPVLIQGETGTGKEVIARHAHEFSGRKGAFVGVNCGALPAELIEAELFGYEAGAFTGARREGSPGLIASAHGGTLLLDEIAELPLGLQASLLRFLDDRCVRPVGGTRQRVVDVQLLAASHVDLPQAVTAKRFRHDLLYRLNVVEVRLPPLRQRTDLAEAVHFVLDQLDPAARLSPEALELLCEHDWPGNFRELRSVLTRLLVEAGSDESVVHLDRHLVETVLPNRAHGTEVAKAGAATSLQRAATQTVLQAFDRCGHSVSRTSRTLGISRTTVYRHLREAGRVPQRADHQAD